MDAPAPLPATEPKPPVPLLPPLLLGANAMLWLWVLPVAVLLALNVQAYGLIEGNMDASQHHHANLFGLAGALNLLLGVGLFFAGRRQARKNPESAGVLSVWWAVPVIAVQVAYLWLAVAWGDRDLLPSSVTEWIYPPQRFFYNQFAFAMVPLFLGLIRLACARPAKGRGKALLFNLGLAVAAPVALYGLFQVLSRSDRYWDFGPYVVSTLVIVLGLLMFVGIIRGLALGLRDIDAWSGTGERIAILVFALALPVGGLILNREIPFPNDFQAWEVYALTAANAAILLLASWQHARRPLLSLGLLCATLPFTLYFFVVFLPFLPLAILAVALMGAGFLVLTPTVLLILHLGLLNKARRGSHGRRLVTGVLCFLLLPAFFTVRGLADKAALNAALDYVYSPAIKAGPLTYGSSRVNLRRALSNHRSYKNGIYYPLLSDYYAWLVFDNLVLPDDKLARLESAFFGAPGSAENKDPVARNRGNFWDSGRSSNRERNHMPRSAPPPRTVEAAKLDVSAKSADGQGVVTLALTLRNTGSQNAEYIKKLPLPAGVYVSGFRLHVAGVAVPGRITEKKTALWVYSMIRDSERRDPGLLFYNAPDELELRVFPVAAGTPSVVEVDFLVPAELAAAEVSGGSNDPAQVLRRIGERLSPRLVRTERGTVVAGGLATLPAPPVKRDAYLHVIVDRSADNGFDGDLPAVIRSLKGKFPEARFVRITLANYETVALATETESMNALPLRGGFVPDLALAQALRRHRDEDLDSAATGAAVPPRPVFVLLGKNAAAAAPGWDVAKAWRDLVPALEIHSADAAGVLTAWPVEGRATGPLLRLGNSVRPLVEGRPLRFKTADADAVLTYASTDTADWVPAAGIARVDAGAPWGRATALQLSQQDYARTPGDAGTDLKALVKASRESGVMLASTSYIVVENAAQWRMIDVSERQKLDQNAALNFKEAPAPSWVWLGAGFALWLGWRRRKIFNRGIAKSRA